MLANPQRLALEAIAAALTPPPSVDYLAFAEQHIVLDGQIPCIFPASREFSLQNRFAADWLVSQAVGSPRFYFPVCENPRHSRGLGWRAPVSDR